MDPQVPTSFIPKQALTAQKARSGGIGLFTLVALLVFLLSIVAAGGVFAYTGILTQKLARQKADLELQKGAFDPVTIRDLLRLDSRLEQGKMLLAKHVAPSGIFAFLSEKTLVNVQFSSLDYSLNADGTAAIQLDGTADSFSTIALQSDALGKSAQLRDVIFSAITVGAGNRVSFTVHATVDPSIISYANNLAATQTSQSVPTQ